MRSLGLGPPATHFSGSSGLQLLLHPALHSCVACRRNYEHGGRRYYDCCDFSELHRLRGAAGACASADRLVKRFGDELGAARAETARVQEPFWTRRCWDAEPEVQRRIEAILTILDCLKVTYGAILPQSLVWRPR